MLSISVFLLLAGWKGVRGGLSQLIYHIKYQPSSTFSLPRSPLHFLSLLSLFSPHSLFFTSYHLHLFFSLVLSTFLSLVLPAPPTHTSLQSLSHSLTLLPLRPPAVFWRFTSLSLFFLSFFLTTAICLHASPPVCPVMTLGLSRFPLPFRNTDVHSPPSCQICRGTICLIRQKNAAMQEDFFNQS